MPNSAVLIEGRNFYAGSKRWARDHSINFIGLRDLLREQTSTTITTLRYYMGVDRNGDLPVDSVGRISEAIEQISAAGYDVRTFPMRIRTQHCTKCGVPHDEIVEKQVDSAIAVEAMYLATNLPRTDVFVLVTNDTDQLPLIHMLKALGKTVWLAVWHMSAVSHQLADHVNGIIVLDDHRDRILGPLAQSDEPVTPEALDRVIEELETAERQFSGGYVGLHYFLKHWRSTKIPRSVTKRSELLNELINTGLVAQYKAPDGNVAVRRVERT